MAQQPVEAIRTLDWESLIPEAEWDLYKPVLDNLRAAGVRFSLGGGLAFSEYARRVRNTKDLDLYVFPWERDSAIACLLNAGFEDYYDVRPYDRSWIFRGHRGDVIVDLIWTAPNHRMLVDPRWASHGRDVVIHGVRLKVIPPEELIWAKLYVVQRDRNDWPDLLNVLDVIGPFLDWRHLLDRLGVDAPLLGGLLSTYRWLSPDGATRLPAWLWEQVGLTRDWKETSSEDSHLRSALLDSREWFGPKETLDPAS